jgi:predicted dehydrogenase
VNSSPSGPVLRIGTLGAAAITPAALIQPAKITAGVEVSAVAARDRGAAERFAGKHGIGRVHDSYDDLIADPEIDAVYVPLPNGLHGRWTIPALRAGKHVLCEKPIAANATEAAEMKQVADETGLVLMEAFHWRYHPANLRLFQLVADGAIGDVTRIDAAICFPLIGRGGDIRWRADLAGGALMDAGCYPVNMVRAVAHAAGLGEPEVTSAEAKLTRGTKGRGVVDRAMRGELRWDLGRATGSVQCSMLSSKLLALSLDVRGTEGRLQVRNPIMPSLFGRLSGQTAQGRISERSSKEKTYTCQLEAFVGAVQRGEPFPSTAEDGICNMATIDAMYRAAGLEPRVPSA